MSAKDIQEMLRKSAQQQAPQPPDPPTGAVVEEGDGMAFNAQ